MKFGSLCAAGLVTLAVTPAAPALAEKGKPELTEQTMRSGGAIPEDQAKLRFTAADLAFEVFPQTETLQGVATLDFTTTAALDRLLIDLDRNLPVSAVSINGRTLKPDAWSNPEGKLTIRLPRRIAKGGAIKARIVYGGTPHVAVRAPWDDGMVWSKTPDGKPWVATTAEGYGCDLFWPCLDFPTGEPGRVDLHITVPKGLKAPSNGVLRGVDTLPDGRTRWNWSVTNPNTYAIALNVGPYEQMSGTYKSRYGNEIPMQLWYLPEHEKGAKQLFAEFAPTLDFFESEIGPYPFRSEKVGVVETPYLGMEHQTINAYGNDYKPAAEGFDWLFQHEFSHEWFGNQLTAANWDDYWLHEGYGTYMQPFYGRWREGEARYAAMMLKIRTGIANRVPIVRDKLLTEEEVYEAGDGGPGLDIYNKGAWMLHTLRNLIGDAAFREVTQRVVYGTPDPRPGNFRPRFGSTDEFIRTVNDVTGKDYGWFFQVYLKQAALPRLEQERSADRLSLHWDVPGNGPFPLPVEVQIGDRIETLPMTGGKGSIAIPEGAHVIIDPYARILKADPAIERLHAWEAAQK
ncbi:M1 family metallopeptidase [Stakelama pacifica]|uniref:Peptidase M1-like protein n=1 Tax=Stakelama pacifica TaxID=517720 RepID=A0A4R6FS14_9SPHN|nr:M1 family metallopeptidase [Stakelama pacifica]TDN84462.1 peptidase M1-like protein [Stakelama pacifica]GGO93740.1 peptidase M1 [Stakelama pacifica]